MALAIDITDGRGPISEARRELLVKKLGNVFFSFFYKSRGNQHPLPPPLAQNGTSARQRKD